MKSIKMFVVGLLFFVATGTFAQVSVNVNVGGPPVWAPAAPVEVQFYYLPDIEVYYDVPAERYIYLNNGVWIRTVQLPIRYRGYDLHVSHPVYLTDYKGKKPYVHFKEHKVKYKGKGHYKHKDGKGKDKGKKGGHKKG